MEDLEYLTCTDQEDTAERDVVRSLFGYEDEEDFLEDIEASSLERLEELANILEDLEDGARYYRQKCLLELKEYSDGLAPITPSSKLSTVEEMYRTLEFPLTTDSTRQSESSPEHAGPRHAMSTSSEDTSGYSQNSTNSTSLGTMIPNTDSASH